MSDAFVYRLFQPAFTVIFKVLYNPKYVNKGVIPKDGACVIAGNHKHALDPIFVDSSTGRVIHTLAKKELHDGPFGWFFRAVGSIPVDLDAKHNKGALNAAVEYLNKGYAINVSPEAGRNYT
ncbi:MAG: 1-acyl-sn-glycerol-3-phosphate acyltransferase, partial [Lachnospiraceae bacterium]|nr:1-acyl-sn-glycerol-3-phosphate acyltransferase [Lachnospiraceae bacterium]